jgi:hypothetical protein
LEKQVSSSGFCHFIEPMKYCRDLSQQKIKWFELGTSHSAKAGPGRLSPREAICPAFLNFNV